MDRPFDAKLDARGLPCPLPLLKAKQALAGLVGGQVLLVLTTDEAAPRDFAAYAEATGHRLERVESVGDVIGLYLRKRDG
ncbi:MAG: sulfurtransferase TusA family protein [Halothiobacillaceae bacterium]